MENNPPTSGFNVLNIILVESSFSRINQVVFDQENIRNDMNIHVDTAVNGEQINVAETVTITQVCNEVEQVKIKVRMVGLFEHFGDIELPLETFGRVNGAAIIFPYIREHITSLSQKAGIPPIILPTVNFANSVEEKK